jgi:maleate cis-trans isomerase
VFLQHPGADAIYVQGGKIRMLDIVETLERDLQVPVLHPGVAAAWEIMLRLHVREPKAGFGRLLAELPAG